MWEQIYTQPHIHSHANYTSEAEQGDLRYLGSEILSKQKSCHVMSHVAPFGLRRYPRGGQKMILLT